MFESVWPANLVIVKNLALKPLVGQTVMSNYLVHQELEEKKLNTVVDLQLAKQQALDNPGDELCEKNADLIRAGLVKLEEHITETLTELRYELLEIDPPA